MALSVLQQTEKDWPLVWAILKPAFRAGDSYPLPQNISEQEAKAFWIKQDGFNAVARDERVDVVGVYYLRPDQGGPGAHICNAGYVISESARGKGYAVDLCRHSQRRAAEMGFKGMKFNLVVSTNKAALRAWEKAGMSVIGTVPKAFDHPQSGLVDAYIMYFDLTA